MHGNVWGWCADGKCEYASSCQTDPAGGPSLFYMLRGGGWDIRAISAVPTTTMKHWRRTRTLGFGWLVNCREATIEPCTHERLSLQLNVQFFSSAIHNFSSSFFPLPRPRLTRGTLCLRKRGRGTRTNENQQRIFRKLFECRHLANVLKKLHFLRKAASERGTDVAKVRMSFPGDKLGKTTVFCLTATTSRTRIGGVRGVSCFIGSILLSHDWVVDLMDIRSAKSRFDSVAVRAGTGGLGLRHHLSN